MWISIDTPPPEDETVLTYSPSEGMNVGWWHLAWEEDHGGYPAWIRHSPSFDDEMGTPTHWMPLPEEP